MVPDIVERCFECPLRSCETLEITIAPSSPRPPDEIRKKMESAGSIPMATGVLFLESPGAHAIFNLHHSNINDYSIGVGSEGAVMDEERGVWEAGEFMIYGDVRVIRSLSIKETNYARP